MPPFLPLQVIKANKTLSKGRPALNSRAIEAFEVRYTVSIQYSASLGIMDIMPTFFPLYEIKANKTLNKRKPALNSGA